MGDPSKFSNLFCYYTVTGLLLFMVAAEIVLFIYTNHNHTKQHTKLHKGTGSANDSTNDSVNNSANGSDKGTMLLLVGNFIMGIEFSFFFVSHQVPESVRNLVLPDEFTYLGIVMMLAGISLRIIAIFTLKRAFTYQVQTTKEQHLITNGVYHLLRNPSYTGSFLSLVGTALSLRSIIGIPAVVLLSLICYSVRIRVEENTLRQHFGQEYTEYEAHTFRLIPYVW